MRFSDFYPKNPFRGREQPAKPEPAEQRPADKPPLPAAEPPAPSIAGRPEPPAANPEPAAALPADPRDLDPLRVYGRGVEATRRAFRQLGRRPSPACAELRQFVSDAAALLGGGGQPLLAAATRSTADSYLYAHSVNVAIFSLALGRGLGWEGRRLETLGLAALLADAGMMRHLELAEQPRRLEPDELLEIRRHPAEGAAWIGEMEGLEEPLRRELMDIVAATHERRGGAGYPRGSEAELAHPAAQIIGLCDVYEAISHPRGWRPALTGPDAVKELLQRHAAVFEPALVRALVERLTLYPPGSLVTLSSGAIARVVEVRADFPTRPAVEIVLDGNGRAPGGAESRLDLLSDSALHVAGGADPARLEAPDPKALLALEADRWWTAYKPA